MPTCSYSKNLQDIQLVDILQGVKGLDRIDSLCFSAAAVVVSLREKNFKLTALQIQIYSNRLSGYIGYCSVLCTRPIVRKVSRLFQLLVTRYIGITQSLRIIIKSIKKGCIL